MARYRKHSMASAVALAFGLSACGGGGGGGGGVASTPPPPPIIPTPTPTPAAVISAAAPPVVPDASLFPTATAGGPTIQSHSQTTFPLLQTVVSITPNRASPDTAAMAGGASLSSSEPNGSYTLNVPGAGLNNVAMVGGGSYYNYCYAFACGFAGSTEVELVISSPAGGELSWTQYGSWLSHNSAERKVAAFATGFATPVSLVPTSGTATYNGSVIGHVMYPDATAHLGVGTAQLNGNASLAADFGARSMAGSLTNMAANGAPWNSVSLSGSISASQNLFSGTTGVTSTPAGVASLGGSATGTFSGMFFGPGAQELGAVWTLSDGSRTATGAIGAKRP